MGLFSKKKKQTRNYKNVHRRNYFAAAKLDRLTAGWSGIEASADQSISSSLTRLRARSRNMAFNNDYARRFLKLCRSNVIGPQGIMLQVKAIERETPKEIIYDDAANRMIENAWDRWSKIKYCTIDGRLSWVDVQHLAIEAVARDGEIFIRKIKGKAARNPFGFALQLIEADHVDENHNENLSNGNKIRMGIEFDSDNRPVAYHVLNRHPGDNFTSLSSDPLQRQRIFAEDIIHLYSMERPSQSRGLPMMTSAMARMKMLGGYEEAELVAARIGASKMGFYTSPDGGGYTGQDEEDDQVITEAEPGIFEQLPEGVNFTAFDPQHPTGAFQAFVKTVLRGAAAGLGVSYNSLANDLEGVNFSSIRQGALEERDLWKVLQQWVVEHLCQDVFEDWLLWSITTGEITLPVLKFEKFNRAIWRPRGWSWVDPLKEVKANREAMEAGLKSSQDIASEQGNDIEDVYAQIAAEQNLREKYGISLAAKKTANGNSELDTENGAEDEEDKE